MYVQNTTVEALRLPWWRQITHNLEHYFLSGAPFMDKVFFPEGQQVSIFCKTDHMLTFVNYNVYIKYYINFDVTFQYLQVSRHLWTEGDRNMSEFFIYAFSNFSWYG